MGGDKGVGSTEKGGIYTSQIPKICIFPMLRFVLLYFLKIGTQRHDSRETKMECQGQSCTKYLGCLARFTLIIPKVIFGV